MILNQVMLLTLAWLNAGVAAGQGSGVVAGGQARQRLTDAKIAEDLGRHAEARAAFGALVADSSTPMDVSCEALVRQGATTWQHVDVREGVALLQSAREKCPHDLEAMRLLVSVVTGVEQDPETWRGRNEAFVLTIVETFRGPEPAINFLADQGRDPFSASSAETPLGGRAWVGEPVTVNVKDASLMDVFRLVHEISDLNIVVDPAVRDRKITLEMRDVPWDQMLELILRTQGLAASMSGNVMRIAPLQRLASERFAGSVTDLARQQETMKSLEAVSAALVTRRGIGPSWPVVPTVARIAELEASRFFTSDVPSRDAWGNDIVLWSDGKLLRIVSPGSDGVLEHADLAGYLPSVARHPEKDLVWQDGEPLTTVVDAP